jgi:hypothetical protein
VKLRFVTSLIAAALLAACASGASTYNPSTASPTGNASLDRPAAKGPTYNVSIALLDARSTGDSRSHAGATIGSLRAITNVKKHKYVFVVNNSVCPMTLSGTTATGCGVVSTSATSYTTQKANFDFYSKPGGKGCLLATAQYKGALYQNEPLQVTFKAQNTKKCWK